MLYRIMWKVETVINIDYRTSGRKDKTDPERGGENLN